MPCTDTDCTLTKSRTQKEKTPELNDHCRVCFMADVCPKANSCFIDDDIRETDLRFESMEG